MSNATCNTNTGSALPRDASEVRETIRRMVGASSVFAVAKLLNLSRHAVLVLSHPVAEPTAGTIALGRERLAALPRKAA